MFFSCLRLSIIYLYSNANTVFYGTQRFTVALWPRQECKRGTHTHRILLLSSDKLRARVCVSEGERERVRKECNVLNIETRG